MTEHVIIHKYPERQRDGVFNIARIRDDAEWLEVELAAENDDGSLSVENSDEEQGKADGELNSVVDSVICEEILQHVILVQVLNFLFNLDDFTLDFHVFNVVFFHWSSSKFSLKNSSLLFKPFYVI